MLYSVFKFIRPLNIVLGVLTLFVVGYIIGPIQANNFIYLSIVLVCYMIAGNILNDFIDLEIDRINKPHRFLVKHDVSSIIIILAIVLLICIGSLFALKLLVMAKYIALLFALPLLISYELFFKKMPLIGNIVISLLVASVFIYTEAGLTGHVDITMKIFVLAFMLNLIREIIKDIQDVKGDSSHDYKTLPIILGISKTILVIRVVTALFITISFHPSYIDSYTWYYSPLIIITIHLPLLYIMWNLRDNIASKDYQYFSNLLKLLIINGIIIIIVSS